jgi:hypothetical protein
VLGGFTCVDLTQFLINLLGKPFERRHADAHRDARATQEDGAALGDSPDQVIRDIGSVFEKSHWQSRTMKRLSLMQRRTLVEKTENACSGAKNPYGISLYFVWYPGGTQARLRSLPAPQKPLIYLAPPGRIRTSDQPVNSRLSLLLTGEFRSAQYLYSAAATVAFPACSS